MSRQPSSPAPKRGWGVSGADVVKTAERETQLAKERAERKGPNRFWLKAGERAEIVILDKNIDSAFGLFEHAIAPHGNFKETYFEVSLKTLGEEDPLEIYPCVYGKTSKAEFITFLSILDLTPYTNSKGQVVPFTRKLLPIKRTQVQEFKALSDRCVQNPKFGGLRGLHLMMERSTDDKSPRIGTPKTLDTMEYGFFNEQELLRRFAHPAIMSAKNQVIIPANGMIQPYDYEAIFKAPDLEDIRKRYQWDAPVGSSVANDAVWGSSVDTALADDSTPQNTQSTAQEAQTETASFIVDDEMADDIPF